MNRLTTGLVGLGLLGAMVSGCSRSSPPALERLPGPAPELEGGLTWLNSSALRLAQLQGKVVLLDFFDYSCVNCLRTFPYLQEWQRRYGEAGLVIIGIHTPQYDFAMDPLNVLAATRRLGLTFPVLVDSQHRVADAYGNRFWPQQILIDQAGSIRFEHTGEGAYVELERWIQRLLRRHNPQLALPPVLAPLRPTDRADAVCYPTTRDLYLGQLRGQLANAPAASTNSPVLLRLPTPLHPDHVYATGQWQNESEYLRHTRDCDELSDCVVVVYRASEINVVMKPEEIYWLKILVRQDGQWLRRGIAGADIEFDELGRSYVKCASPRMYNLVAGQPYGPHEIRLYPRSKGLSVYSFSFGTCEIPRDVDRLGKGKNAS